MAKKKTTRDSTVDVTSITSTVQFINTSNIQLFCNVKCVSLVYTCTLAHVPISRRADRHQPGVRASMYSDGYIMVPPK